MAAQRPFAVFDIDGTLIRWQLYHAVADELANKGLLSATAYQKVKDARMTWKKRESIDSFKLYEQLLVGLVDQAMVGLAVDDLRQASENVINEYKDQVYAYTRDLIYDLKKQGYLLFAISASQREIVELLANYYGFDDFGGSHYPTKNGHYTGEKDVLKRERKPQLLAELVKKHAATYEGSLGVGDSESDIPMLEAVERPIAFNPTKQLFDHARSNQWKIVIERKNVIYQLEPGDGSYLLA